MKNAVFHCLVGEGKWGKRKIREKVFSPGPTFLILPNWEENEAEKCLEIHFTQIPSHLPLTLFMTWLLPPHPCHFFLTTQQQRPRFSLSLSLSLALFNQHSNVWLFAQVKNVAQVKKQLPTKVCWPCLNKWKSFEHLTLLFANHVFWG